MREDIEKESFSVIQFLRQVVRRRKLFAIAAVAFAAAAAITANFLPLKYTGKAIFEFGLEAAADQIARAGRESFGTIKERLQHDISGYQAVEKACEELGLMQGLPRDSEGRLTTDAKAQRQKMIDEYVKQIHVNWEARSTQEDLVSITFTDSNPVLAEQMPNALVAGYINRTYEKIRTGLTGQHDFLRGKVDECDRVVNDLTRKKIQYETANGGVLPENAPALQELILRTRHEIEAHRRLQTIAKATRTRIKALPPTSEPANPSVRVVHVTNPELTRLLAKLTDLKTELDTNLSVKQMTAQHPKVLQLQQEIAQVEKRLEETPPDVLKEQVIDPNQANAAVTDISAQLSATETDIDISGKEITRLEGLLANYESLWANFPAARQEYIRFLKEYEERRGEAQQWRGRMDEVEVALAATVNNRLTRLRAIQPAQEQIFPAWPALWMVVTAVVLGSLLFGGVAVFLASVFDRTVSSADQAMAYFNLPVQGVISCIVTPYERSMRRLRQWTVVPLVSVVVLIVLSAATFSIVLRLQYPQMYKEWQSSPVEFVHHQIFEPSKTALKNL